MTASLDQLIRNRLRAIPDYPQPGILFQDITPVLGDPDLLREVSAAMARPFAGSGITKVVGIEARGFILGGTVALELSAGFVPVRKPGKLPYRTIRQEYVLEYGTNVVEAHEDAFERGERVLIVDDVLATGGTAAAAAGLVQALGATVAGWSFLLEIGALAGRARLGAGVPVEAIVTV